MKPDAHGMRRQYNHRLQVEREKLEAKGWKVHENASLPGDEFWQHPDRPGYTYQRRAAEMLQTSWDKTAWEGAA